MTSIALEIANSFVAAGDEDAFFIFDDRNDEIIDNVIKGDPLEVHASKESGVVIIRGGLRFYETLRDAQDAVWPVAIDRSHAYISILKVKLPKFCTVWFDDGIPERVMYIAPALLLPEPKIKKSHS